MSDDLFTAFFLFVYVPVVALIAFVVITYLMSILWKKPLSPNNKAVLISGCDSGIGLRVAEHLYSLGLHVFAACFSDQSHGHQTLANRSKYNIKRMTLIQLDITNSASINASVIVVAKKLVELEIEGLWALINNAGICIYGEFDWLTWDQMLKQVSVNLLGTISLTKAFLPLVKEAKGRIVNVGSVNGICAYPGLSVYCATKFGIEGFSDVLRHEMRKLGVKVILIRPGDFARLTGIMSRQEVYASEMWDQMSPVNRMLYNTYFQDYHAYIQKNYGMTSPASFEKSSLLADFESALLSQSPPYAMTVSPLQFRMFFTILRLLPASTKDLLIDWLYARVFGFDASKYFAGRN